MLLGIMPTVAFAQTTLSSVAITGISAPVAGVTPDYDAQCGSEVVLDAGNNNAAYYKNGIAWFDVTNPTANTIIPTNTKFVEEHQYKIRMIINATGDNVFSQNVSVTIDGNPATVTYRFSDTSIEVEMSYPTVTVTPITSVEYYMDVPIAAGNFYETVTLDTINGADNLDPFLYEWDGKWYENDVDTGNPDDYTMCTENSYEAGVAYAFRAEITVKNGYKFTVNSSVKLTDGNETYYSYLQSLSPDGKTAVFFFFFDAIESNDSRTEIFNVLLKTNVVDAEKGKSFFYPAVHAVNGDEANKTAVIVPPKGEEYGWYVSNFNIKDSNYKYVGDENLSGKFEDKKSYMLIVILTAKNGYKFSPECWIPMSTPDGLREGEILYAEDDYVCVAYYFDLGAPTKMPKATSAKITLRGYEKGNKIQDTKVSVAINGQHQPCPLDKELPEYGFAYAILDKNNMFIESGTFAYGTIYKLSVMIYGENYDVSELKAKNITLNGVPAYKIEKFEHMIMADFALEPLTKPIANPFKDVKKTAYYFDSVLWAVKRGITAGVSATKFAPDETCTRAQVVSFLWRAAGSPEPKTTKNPFADVKKDAYYYKAVLWAVENGITAGVSATKFAPNDPCTRAQVVSFLWRAEGYPKPETTKNPFKDVKTGTYYYDAVMWAVESGVTAGVSATSFAPDSPCTRAQIVRFLDKNFR